MVKLLIIADDFTGALDTGVQFAKRSIPTQVFTHFTFDNETIEPDTKVLVIDTETRAAGQEEAYRTIHKIVEWSKKQKIEMIFKKTDSALRGNIGSELQAVLDHFPETPLSFIPGHPSIERTVEKGIAYVSGERLEDSVFGNDPFEPVTESSVSAIIHQQSQVEVTIVSQIEDLRNQFDKSSGIQVYDTLTNQDINDWIDELLQQDQLKLLAGCTALANQLAEKIFHYTEENTAYEKVEGLYIACGSLNDITKRQVEYAESHGFERKQLKDEKNLSFDESSLFMKELIDKSKQHRKIIVDTFDFDAQEHRKKHKDYKKKNERYYIMSLHSILAKKVLSSLDNFALLMTGGDTLMGFMEEIHCDRIQPITEIEEGVVLSEIEYKGEKRQVLSKSGGFGTEDVFCKIVDKIIVEESRVC